MQRVVGPLLLLSPSWSGMFPFRSKVPEAFTSHVLILLVLVRS